jgi:hypothetical protein
MYARSTFEHSLHNLHFSHSRHDLPLVVFNPLHTLPFLAYNLTSSSYVLYALSVKNTGGTPPENPARMLILSELGESKDLSSSCFSAQLRVLGASALDFLLSSSSFVRDYQLSTEHPTRMLILSEPGESKGLSSTLVPNVQLVPGLTPFFPPLAQHRP